MPSSVREDGRWVLRREGLYYSHVQNWREAQDQGVLTGLSAKPAGRPSHSETDIDNERLRKEKERLTSELAKAEDPDGRERSQGDLAAKAHSPVRNR
ncbi:MAG: hypothetical protein ACRDR6_14805 [Pseudonocardiaceae bacterium]